MSTTFPSPPARANLRTTFEKEADAWLTHLSGAFMPALRQWTNGMVPAVGDICISLADGQTYMRKTLGCQPTELDPSQDRDNWALVNHYSRVERDIYGNATLRSHSRTCSYCKSEATISTHCKNCGAPA